MVLTALIMGMTAEAGRPMTDAEVRAKALTLGMVDSNSLSLSNVGTSSGGKTSQESPGPSPAAGDPTPDQNLDESPQPGIGDETASPSPSDEPRMPGGEETPSPSPSPDETPMPGGEETPSPSQSPDESQSPVPESETVTIVIVRGDSSYTVSRRLEEAGLVEDAREYDSYLVANGYSKTIRTGTHKIPMGATWKEIAEIIA